MLLIRGTGRTGIQDGDAAKSYDSIVGKLFRLPDDTLGNHLYGRPLFAKFS